MYLVAANTDTALPDLSISPQMRSYTSRGLFVKPHMASWSREEWKKLSRHFFSPCTIIGVISLRMNKTALIRRFVTNALYTAYVFTRVFVSQFLTLLLNITIKAPIHCWTNRRCELTVKDESRSISPGDAFANYFW